MSSLSLEVSLLRMGFLKGKKKHVHKCGTSNLRFMVRVRVRVRGKGKGLG